MSIREKIEDDRENDLKKKKHRQLMCDYDYENKSQLSIFRQQHRQSTS